MSKTKKIHRSSVTGKIVSSEEAKANPKETYADTVPITERQYSVPSTEAYADDVIPPSILLFLNLFDENHPTYKPDEADDTASAEEQFPEVP